MDWTDSQARTLLIMAATQSDGELKLKCRPPWHLWNIFAWKFSGLFLGSAMACIICPSLFSFSRFRLRLPFFVFFFFFLFVYIFPYWAAMKNNLIWLLLLIHFLHGSPAELPIAPHLSPSLSMVSIQKIVINFLAPFGVGKVEGSVGTGTACENGMAKSWFHELPNCSLHKLAPSLLLLAPPRERLAIHLRKWSNSILHCTGRNGSFPLRKVC